MALNSGPRPATPADLPALVETLRLAFEHDPVWGRVLARPDGRTGHVDAFWRLWLEGALRYPWVWTIGDGAAVSVWIPPGGSELSDEQESAFEKLAADSLEPAGGAYLAEVMDRFGAAHPRTEAHYYLDLLGTHPAHRGRGIGMALLADDLARIDAEGRPAYLESSNPANDQRYERLGFRAVGAIQLPELGTTVTTMWREARRV